MTYKDMMGGLVLQTKNSLKLIRKLLRLH